jgi:hypothetical protein
MGSGSFPTIAVMAAGRGPVEAAEALQELLAMEAMELPGAALHLCSDHKVDTAKRARLLNLEANHPLLPLQLRNLALQLGSPQHAAAFHREAFTWVGLHTLAQQLTGVDVLLLLGQAWDLTAEERLWLAATPGANRSPFLRAGRNCRRDSFFFDLRSPVCADLLTAMAGLHSTGTTVAMSNGSSIHALRYLATSLSGSQDFFRLGGL